MKIQRTVARDGTILPRAESVIRGLPARLLHHEAHGLKHPLAVYQTSLTRISTAWMKVFPLLHSLRFQVMGGVQVESNEPLLEAYEALLYRLNEHIDSSYEILCSLRAPGGKEYRWNTDFLRAQKIPGYKTFRESVQKGYREDHLGRMVNEMKHQSAQLRGVFGKTDNDIVLGFFVDGPRAGGVIGPNARVHKRFKHFETAFSYSRDMLMHFWWIYRSGELLSECIEATVLQDHGERVIAKPAGHSLGNWSEVCLQCAALRAAFFVDECERHYPLVVVSPDATAVTIEFPTTRPAVRHKNMHLQVLLQLTETNRAFMMPYLQQAARK